MDVFCTSYLSSFPNTNFIAPTTFITSLDAGHNHNHENFTRLLQHAQSLRVRILPLVWEPAFEVLGRDGATGRVNEDHLNAKLAFAFKRFKPDNTNPSLSDSQFRDLQYSAMINEMTILSHPAIGEHDNITYFIGVGFELFSDTGEVWPMLIFSRLNQGDLGTYMAQSTSIQDGDILLGICGQVAKAVQILHKSNVIHGDIKPANVLIHHDVEHDSVSVVLADFGFSAFSNTDDDLVYLPRSEPWEAPELHGRAFRLADAQKTDIYSFGLLCLWLFLRNVDMTDLGFPRTKIGNAFSGTDLDAFAAIQELKRDTDDAMLIRALRLLRGFTSMRNDLKHRLEQVFRMTLVRIPSERNTTMENLVDILLGTQDQSHEDQTRTDAVAHVTAPKWHGSLSIGKLFFHLEACDYRIHSFLTQALVNMAENTDFTQNTEESSRWLSRSKKTSDEMSAAIMQIKDAHPDAGFLLRKDGILSLAIKEYRSMILARQRSLGPSHFSTQRLKSMLIYLLRWKNEYEEALGLAHDMIDNGKLEASDIMELKSSISLILHKIGNNTKAELIERELLNEYGSNQLAENTGRIDREIDLVGILTARSEHDEAIELGQKVLKDSIAILGTHHSSTRAARRTLASSYYRCGKLVEALHTTEELVQSEEQFSKLEHISPKIVEDVSRLGTLYYQLGRDDSAFSCYAQVQEWIKRSTGNARYAANAINNLGTTLILRGDMSEAKTILEPLFNECHRLLGLKCEETALVMGNLAVVYHSEKDYAKAEQLERQVIDTRREVLGLSHPNTLTALGNHRALLLEQDKFDQALEVAREEVICVKSSPNTSTEAVTDVTLTISIAFETAGAFENAISILEESICATEGRGPLQGACRVVVQRAICYIHLGQVDKGRETFSTLLETLQVPFKEDLNIFIPDLLRLAKTWLLRDCTVEAKQALNLASVLSQKSNTVTDHVFDQVRTMASELHQENDSSGPHQ
ncbi:hypothetical protein ZTR_02801 [Talaromyces verruculosus]|nr:hypothetical protein ZTR_02801 [Talaromyces verruculosus]